MIIFQQRIKKAAIVFAIPIFSFILAPLALAVTASEITNGLACTCGCNMVVSACEGSMECSVAKQITDQVTQMVNEGQSKDEIIRSFVKKYGERILAAPTKKGFNLMAWIMPFLALMLGGGGLYLFLNRCLSSGKTHTEALGLVDEPQTLPQKYLDQFEKELSAFDG